MNDEGAGDRTADEAAGDRGADERARDVDADTDDVAAFVDYCRLQARLCSGKAETLREEVADLLDELDSDLAALRDRVVEPDSTDGTTAPPEPGAESIETDELVDAESDVEEKQALVEAKQARLTAYQDLAEGYVDLATDLQEAVEDDATAVERIVEFEVDRDAPAYFPDRETLAETAAKSNEE
jgi:hypothetical protein